MGDSERIGSSAPPVRAQTPAAAGTKTPAMPQRGYVTAPPIPEPRPATDGSVAQAPEIQPIPDQRPPIEQVSPENKGFIEDVEDRYKEGEWISAPFSAIGDAILSDQKTNTGLIGGIKVLLAMPFALVAAIGGMLEPVPSQVKWLLTSAGERINPKTDYAGAKSEYEAAKTAYETLQAQASDLSTKAAEKNKEAENAVSAAKSAASGITSGDEKNLKIIEAQAKITLQAKELAKALKEKQEELADAKKQMEKAQSRFDNASANIPHEAAHLAGRAARDSREASGTLSRTT